MSALQPTPQRFGSFERERQLGGVDSLSQFSFLKLPKSRRPYVSRGTSIQQRSRGRKEMIYLAKVAWRSRSSAVEDQRRAWGRGAVLSITAGVLRGPKSPRSCTPVRSPVSLLKFHAMHRRAAVHRRPGARSRDLVVCCMGMSYKEGAVRCLGENTARIEGGTALAT